MASKEEKNLEKEVRSYYDDASTHSFYTELWGEGNIHFGYFDSLSKNEKVKESYENAAFALEDGKFTKQPVQTQFGWHVIKVESKEVAPAPSIEEMRDQLVQTLSTQALGRVLEGLRATHDIKLRSFDDIRKDALATVKDKQ